MQSPKFRKVGENCLCDGKWVSVLTQTDIGLYSGLAKSHLECWKDVKNLAKCAALQIFPAL